MADNTLSIHALRKAYGSHTALKDFNYTFESGVYGLLGTNGAGKTTLIRMITSLVEPDSGIISWNGENIQKVMNNYRSVLGYMPQEDCGYGDLTVYRFLNYMSLLKDINKKVINTEIERVLTVTNLLSYKSSKIGGLSQGTKRRVILAQSLIGMPDILVLDEPTSGLDPEERIRIRSYLGSLPERCIVVIATHIVPDVECIADNVIMLKDGIITATGTPTSLIQSIKEKVFERVCTSTEAYELQQKYKKCIIHQSAEGRLLRVVQDDPPDGFSVSTQYGLEEAYLYYCAQ